MSALNAHLLEVLRDTLADIPGLAERRMFGSDGFFANGYAFAIVWDGRIVLKLADAAEAERLLAIPEASVFNPMGKGKGMSGWVVVPESFHDDLEQLAEWSRTAYRLVRELPPKGTKPAAKKPAAKPKPKPKAKANRLAGSTASSRRTGASKPGARKTGAPKAKAATRAAAQKKGKRNR